MMVCNDGSGDRMRRRREEKREGRLWRFQRGKVDICIRASDIKRNSWVQHLQWCGIGMEFLGKSRSGSTHLYVCLRRFGKFP